MKHTPGPWEWVGRDLEAGDYETVIETEVSCGTYCYGGSPVVKVSAADKLLIAAAPDLLEALRGVLSIADPARRSSRLARAAIAKATGDV
jgi:hypothetical protein